MNKWTLYTVEDCCEILDHKRVPLNKEQRERMQGDIPYYGANGIQDLIDRYIFDEDLILLAEDGGNFDQFATRPIAYRISGKSWVNNHAHVLRAKPGFNQDAIYYSLVNKNLLNFIVGGTRSKLNQSELRSITLCLPSYPEQTAIADILTTVDQAIEQTEALIAKQRRIKAGLLHDLLTRGIDEHGHLRDPSTHRFKPSPVGLVPEEWEVRDFDGFGIEIIDGDRGANYPNEHELSNSGYCLFLTNKNIHQGNLDFAVKQFVSQERDTLLGKGKLIVGDQVITTRGTVGNIAKFDETSPYQNVRINSGMVIIRGYGTWFSPDFFVYLWLEFFQKQYSMMSSGSAQPQLPIKDLRRFYLLAPTIAEQKQIAAFLHSADTLIGVERDSHQKLRVLKTGLMQDLLSGRVSVAGLAARSSGSPLGAPIDDHTLS